MNSVEDRVLVCARAVCMLGPTTDGMASVSSAAYCEASVSQREQLRYSLLFVGLDCSSSISLDMAILFFF
jgi:hypothetical protein